MYNITEEQIKDIAQGGGKSKIKQMFPQVFETKLEAGEWYKFYWKGETEVKAIIHLSKVKGYKVHLDYGIWVEDGKWVENDWYNIDHDYRPATAKEVEEALVREAKKKYGEDWQSVKIKEHADKGHFEWYGMGMNRGNFKSGMETERLYGINGVLFYKGKWAEKLSEPKVITKTEAENRLQDLTGEKFKIREEQPDRCEYNLPNWCGK